MAASDTDLIEGARMGTMTPEAEKHLMAIMAMNYLRDKKLQEFRNLGMTLVESLVHMKNSAKGKVPGVQWQPPSREQVRAAVVAVKTKESMVDDVVENIMTANANIMANRESSKEEQGVDYD